MRRRRAALLFALTAIAVLGAAATAEAATTYYAKVGGAGASCTATIECSLEMAVTKATTDGDSIVLRPGSYTTSATLNIAHNIDIGGEAGAAATLVTGPGTGNVINLTGTGVGAGPTLHDVHLAQNGGNVALRQTAGIAERLLVTTTGGSPACDTSGGLLRDSVCVAGGAGDGFFGIPPGGGPTYAPQLRNVTAIGGPAGVGMLIDTAVGESMIVSAANSIFRGGAADIRTNTNSGVGPASAALVNSNYATVDSAGGGSVTPPGTNGNQTAVPLLANPAGGDFHELAGSPTINAGIAEPLIGDQDLDRTARSQSVCLGGASVPDIGGYEIAPPVPSPTCSAFTVGKLQLNKKHGTALVTVTVPGAGTLTATAKGMKNAGKAPAAAGDIVLKLKAKGKAKRKLARTGKAKLNVKFAWAPTRNVAATQTVKVKLKRK
jgi:hypothetical protein